MKAFNTAISIIIAIWVGIYLILCFVYMTFDVTQMAIAHSAVARGLLIVPSVILFIIFIGVYDDSESDLVFVQNGGTQIDSAIISNINNRVDEWDDSLREHSRWKLVVLRDKTSTEYRIRIVPT